MKRGTREYTWTTIGLAVVVGASLFPVFWLLMLSLKTPATIGDGRLIPGERDDTAHMSEKRDRWADAAYPAAGERAGAWNYGSFSLTRRVATSEALQPCFQCHRRAAETEFMFSLEALRAFARTGEVQHAFCDRPGRDPCPE